MKTKRDYTTFDQQREIRKARKLLVRINKCRRPLRSIRIDKNTIVQVRADHPDASLIIDRLKNKKQTMDLIEQIEYGQYA